MVSDFPGSIAFTVPRMCTMFAPVATAGPVGAGPTGMFAAAVLGLTVGFAPLFGRAAPAGGVPGAGVPEGSWPDASRRFVIAYPSESVGRAPVGVTVPCWFGWPGRDGTVTCCGGAVGAAGAWAIAAGAAA